MALRSLRRRDALKLMGSATVLGALLAACGGQPSSGTSSGSTSSQTTAPAPTQASAAAPTQAPAATVANTQAGGAAGPTPTPNPLAQVPIKAGVTAIEWWFGWGGMTALNTFADLGKDFNTKNDQFQIKPLQVSDITQKLLAAIAGGTSPSVETGNITFAQFWITGAAQQLDDFIKSSKVINTSDLYDASLKAGQWKGKTYGVPAVEGFLRWGLSFNQAFLDKAGIKATELPTDFDSLYAFAKAQTVVESSGAIKTLGMDPLDAMGGSFGDGDPFYWPAAYGFKYYDESSGKYNFNNDQMVQAMTMIQKFYDIAGADKIAGFHKSYGSWTESPTAMFPSGVEAANINGYWAPGELAKSSPNNKFVYTWVPTATKGQKLQSTGGHYGMLPKGGPNPDLGFKLIEYLTTDDAMNIIFNGTGWMGARKSFQSKVDTSKYAGLDFFIKSADEANPMWSVIVDPIQAFISDQWGKIQESVNYHKVTPKDAAAQLQKAAESEMQNQFPNGV